MTLGHAPAGLSVWPDEGVRSFWAWFCTESVQNHASSADRGSGEDRLQVLAHAGVAVEHQEAVEAPQEPAVVADDHDGPDVRLKRLLERFGRREVEVVGRLVEQDRKSTRLNSSH